MTGIDVYLGVTGQGVSGLFVASGKQPDFPGPLQAQLIGMTALMLWGVITGLVVNYPLALIAQGLRQSEARRARPRHAVSRPAQPAPHGADGRSAQGADTLASNVSTDVDV
jgi:Amt family ammonium transporter